jgi:predicted nucleotidyltransferase
VGLFEPIIEQLNNNGVRYVVVGGVAVVLHGYARLTADLDLAVDLSTVEARRAIDALISMGFRPTVPVDPLGFADPRVREQWISEKQMKVFSMRDPENPMRMVDLFVENPLDFEELWVRSELMRLADSTVRVASIPDLIAMKRLARRQQDLQDIEALEEILRRRELEDG